MTAFEENEVSINANGGTEIAKRKLESILDTELLSHFQIVNSRVRELNEKKIRVYWAHDLPHDPECKWMADPDQRGRFHRSVFISNWQYQQFMSVLGVPYSQWSTVLESAIEASVVDFAAKPRDVVNLYYGSTPQRGLDILVPVFEELDKQLSSHRLHLHVHSSFKIYGWEERDRAFEPLYERIRAHPNMTYHGFTPHAELKQRLKDYHVLAYPCVWPETSCRVMLEAMSAGMVVVHPNYAALPDTSGSLNFMYAGDADRQKHAEEFMRVLGSTVLLLADEKRRDAINNRLAFNKSYVDTRYDLGTIKLRWEKMLHELLLRYPTEESRRVAGPMFTVRTGA